MGRISKARIKELEKLESEDIKTCTRCGKIKPLYEFSVHSTGRKMAESYCLVCNSKNGKKNQIIRKFGITLADYDKMLEEQGGKCKICGTETPRGMGRFYVDHCHRTKKIRGLLCHNCNILLGNAKDGIKILTSAIQYLNESRK